MSAKPRRRPAAKRQPKPDYLDAFRTPPAGSNLAVIAESFARCSAGPSTLADPASIRPRVLEGIKKAGGPARSPGKWYDKLVAARVELERQALVALIDATAVRGTDGPDDMLALYTMAVFRRCRRFNMRAPLESIYFAVAEDLGPGVGAHEVERLVHWFVSRTSQAPQHIRMLAAVFDAMDSFEPPRDLWINLQANEHEFSHLAGVLDEMRDPDYPPLWRRHTKPPGDAS